ncbi:kinase-like domain-containing protein [Aspergillus insuetus]
MYRRIEGRDAIRTVLDTSDIDRPKDRHQCLVHPPLWDSTLTFLRRNPVERLPSAILAMVLWRFEANEYSISDIKADNIMLGIDDDSVFSDFEGKELEHPVSRKEVVPGGRTIYMSRDLKTPKNIGLPVPCDFSSAVICKEYQIEFVQPKIYRAPEVIIGAPWMYSIDIWNVGCMVCYIVQHFDRGSLLKIYSCFEICDICEGGSLFTGQEPEFQRYRGHAHLAEKINLLGPPPSTLLTKGTLKGKFFTNKRKFRDAHLLMDLVLLEERETTLEGEEERDAFLRLVQKMLQWEPSKRSSAKKLAEDEWIQRHL